MLISALRVGLASLVAVVVVRARSICAASAHALEVIAAQIAGKLLPMQANGRIRAAEVGAAERSLLTVFVLLAEAQVLSCHCSDCFASCAA